jgi:putative ABC transport system permease protein
LAVLVSALGGIAIALSSLSDTLSEWVVDRYRDGILLAVGDPYGVSSGDTFLSAETIEIVKQLDGIVAVAERYAVPMFFRDAHIAVVALDAAVVRVHGRLPVVRGSAPALATALGEGHVAVTEAFARSFALGTGDRVSLDSPAGVRTFQIAGVVRGYGSASGSVWMDIATFDAHWTRPGATSLGVWVEGDRDAAASRILEGTADREPIYLRYGEGLERMLRSSVSRFTRLLWLVAIVVGVFGAIGVLNVLVGATLERQRELSLVHAAGFSISQIGRLVVVDSLLAAGIGSAFGIAGAILLGTLMVETLGESMGWFVDFSSRPQQLVVLAVGVHVVAVLAAIYPLWLTRRAVLAGVVSVE